MTGRRLLATAVCGVVAALALAAAARSDPAPTARLRHATAFDTVITGIHPLAPPA
jgi:hypothetical protein